MLICAGADVGQTKAGAIGHSVHAVMLCVTRKADTMLAMRFDNDSSLPMFEPDAEALPAEELSALQSRRLRGLIDRLLAAGGLQAGRLRDYGVTSGADVGLDDLSRLPTTAKQDLWDNYPFGLLAVPRDR